MIFFLTTGSNRFPIDDYVFSWGKKVLPLIQPLDYEYFFGLQRLHPGTYVFADLELLTDEERALAAQKWERLRGTPQTHLLNHPVKSMRRYELLKTLRAQALNAFNVYRLDEDLSRVRYPVFLRNENDHQGRRSDLIASKAALAEAIGGLAKNGVAGKDALITEFCSCAGKDGVFRKYSSFVLDGTVIARHLFFSRDWHVKHDDLSGPSFVQEELEYVRENPHRRELERVFSAAGIQYGRIDYGLQDGRIQVWEINTNPVVLSFRTPKDTPRVQVQRIFARNFADQWKALARAHPCPRRNCPGQRRAFLHKMHESDPRTIARRRNVRAAKETIAAAFPPSLSVYKHVKKLLGPKN